MPAAPMPRTAKNRGGRLVVINIGETGVDPVCDLRFRCQKWASCGEDDTQIESAAVLRLLALGRDRISTPS